MEEEKDSFITEISKFLENNKPINEYDNDDIWINHKIVDNLNILNDIIVKNENRNNRNVIKADITN